MADSAEEFGRRLRGLIQPDARLQHDGLAYLEQLKAAPDGWRLCADALLSDAFQNEEHVQFYCLQVLEHYVRQRYPSEAEQSRPSLRAFLITWVERLCRPAAPPTKTYVRNKAAQVFALVLVSDWSGGALLEELLALTDRGPPAVDHYLRTLVQLDQEIVDREVVHSEKHQQRNTQIKDAMRERCVPRLAASWLQILTGCLRTRPDTACLCLDVVGRYVSWIDIGLIANADFVTALVGALSVVDVREAAADALHEVMEKGMPPGDKLQLVESLFSVLQEAGVFAPLDHVTDDTPAEDIDYLCKLGRLLNGAGSQLIESQQKLTKPGPGSAADLQLAGLLEAAIVAKMPQLLAFLNCPYDDPSNNVIDFAREYIQLLKSKKMVNETETGLLRDMVFVIINKLKYDDDYDFESMGEDEAMFQEYRKRLKVLYDNVMAVDRELVLRISQEHISATLDNWRTLPMKEVESAITLLYMLGEALSHCAAGTAFFSEDPRKATVLQPLVRQLVVSEVCSHPHPVVPFQYLETVSRYDKFFCVEPSLLPPVLTAFLSAPGLSHPNQRNRARAVYLFSRFTRCLKSQMEPYTEQVLLQIQQLLELGPAAPVRLPAEDQLYLYETVAVLIVCSTAENGVKCERLRCLLTPVLEQFRAAAARLAAAADDSPQLEQLQRDGRHAVHLTARTTKAFSASQTIRLTGCVPLYLQALSLFLEALQGSRQYPLLQSGLVQYLHRLVVCLESEVLPFLPPACQTLLRWRDLRSLQEFLPLLNQLVAKYKGQVVALVSGLLLPVVEAVTDALQRPGEPDDQRQVLQRTYFLFLATLVTNGALPALSQQPADQTRALLLSVAQGAVQLADPAAQRSCFIVLRRLTEAWGAAGPPDFVHFLYDQVVPACFLAPLRPSFDLADAQTVQTLQESAACLRAVYQQRGDELVEFLQSRYLPSLAVQPQAISDYCRALRSDTKVFRNYSRVFFQQARS